jgi:hypothetical protein
MNFTSLAHDTILWTPIWLGMLLAIKTHLGSGGFRNISLKGESVSSHPQCSLQAKTNKKKKQKKKTKNVLRTIVCRPKLC